MSPRALENQEREVQAQRLNRFGRASVVALATLLSFSAISLLAVDHLYRPDTFVIDQLKIKGQFRYLKPVEIEAVIGPEALTNFFSIDLLNVKNKVESLSWVSHADVRREWPNTLLVSVDEHIPVMRWQEDQWVTSTGRVIDLPDKISLPNAIRLYANERDSFLALSTAFRWSKRLLNDELELRKLKLSSSHAWTLSLFHKRSDAEFELLLGREDVESRLTRFQLLFKQKFNQADIQVQRVDARYPDGLAIKAKEISITPLAANNSLAALKPYYGKLLAMTSVVGIKR